VRVVIAEDNLLVRAGIVSILRGAGIDVVAQATCAEDLLREVDEHRPDVAIVDIRMPPDFTDEGVRAAHEIRARHPGIGIVILSSHVDLGTATRVLAESPERLGYLLKDRVGDTEEFVATLRRVAGGGSALDPEVVSRLLASQRDAGPLQALTPREHEVLQLVAEGRSNKGIGDRLAVSERAVQKHVTAIFGKFGLPAGEDDNRRILAVLEYVKR
jgi:DNA-binding NarL/FixJ family response regulator